ncbi:hypothetical protein MGH68_00180 [Erysipelothrix sp. D19-032]
MHVGIDSSLPAQGGADENQESTIAFLAKSGIYRFMADSSDDFLLIPSTDEATKKQFKYISLKNIGSSATVNEGKEMQNNFDKTINLKYPSDLPVLYIRQVKAWNLIQIGFQYMKQCCKMSIKVNLLS